jgi:hypothetical protein
MDISRGVYLVNRANKNARQLLPRRARIRCPGVSGRDLGNAALIKHSFNETQTPCRQTPAGRGGIHIPQLVFCCAVVEFGTVRSGNDGYKSDMKENQHNPESDAARILELLRRRPDEFVSSTAISRDADDGNHSLEDQNWPEPALSRLLALNLVETDGSRNYRLKIVRGAARKASAPKFISPEIKIILRRAGQKNNPEE